MNSKRCFLGDAEEVDNNSDDGEFSWAGSEEDDEDEFESDWTYDAPARKKSRARDFDRFYCVGTGQEFQLSAAAAIEAAEAAEAAEEAARMMEANEREEDADELENWLRALPYFQDLKEIARVENAASVLEEICRIETPQRPKEDWMYSTMRRNLFRFVSLLEEEEEEVCEEDDQADPDDVPSEFRCSLTHDLLYDPVVAADGNTYAPRLVVL